MAEQCGLTMLLMFTARNYKVNGTKMVVQQDFEKGRSHRLWFRRYDR